MFSLALAFLRPKYEVLSQLCFLKPTLKFSEQIFYQSLFNIFPLAIVPFSLWHFLSNVSFPLQQFFSSKSFPQQKA
jgi:hypothetical protein